MAFGNWLQHRVLRQPYLLYTRLDEGVGKPVLLLHGIANSGQSWNSTAKLLAKQPVRTLVFDLLGFGHSVRPVDEWVKYTTDDHARAVVRTLVKSRVHEPVTIVGHSMGCLIAIRVAKLRPDLVDRLILYQPPFYVGLPEGSSAQKRTKFYISTYEKLFKQMPSWLGKFKVAQKVFNQFTGFELTPDNWIPSQRSMKNTIIEQTAVADLKTLTVPTEIIYGTLDGLVIKDTKNKFFADIATHVTSEEIPEVHVISPRASKAIVKRIQQQIRSRHTSTNAS